MLLSLLAICTIPFALAQSHFRGTNHESVLNRTQQWQCPTKNINSPRQNIASRAPFQPSAATHETRIGSEAGLQKLTEFRHANEITPRIETVSPVPPTRNNLMASWGRVSGAQGYLVDVSTSYLFGLYV